MQAEIKDAYWALFDTEGLKTQPGPKLAEIDDALRASERRTEWTPAAAARFSEINASLRPERLK